MSTPTARATRATGGGGGGAVGSRGMQRRQWLLGLMLTMLVAFLWHNGVLDPLERLTLDLRTRYFGFASREPSDRVAVIAIDDGALENVGRWPWDREKLAAVIDELRLAGTSVVALDLLLDDAQSPRWVEVPTRGVSTGPSVRQVFDDAELAGAIRRHGSVVVAASFPFKRGEEGERAAVGEGSPVVVKLADIYATLDKNPELRDKPRDEVLARVQDALPAFKNVTVTRGPLFDKLNLRLDAAMTLLSRERDSSVGMGSAVRPWASSLEPGVPVAAFGSAAARVANVTFDTYDPDGQTRRIPLWVSHHGRLWPTLGLAAVLQYRHAPMEAVTVGERETTFVGDGENTTASMFRARVSSSEVDGLHFVTWPRTLWSKRKPDGEVNGWQWQFYDATSERLDATRGTASGKRYEAEVPIGRVYEPARIARNVNENVVSVARGLDVLASQNCLDESGKAARERVWAAVLDPTFAAGGGREQVGAASWSAMLAEARKAFTGAKENAQAIVDLALDGTSLDKLAEPDRTNIENLKNALVALPRNFQQIDAGLERITAERAALKQRLSGKICFVGWTATGSVSDFVATSIHPRTPGVHVHVAVANSVLTGFQRTPGPGWADLLVLIAMGVLGTWVGVRAGVLFAPLVVLALIVGWFGVSSGLLWDLWWSIWSVAGGAVAAAAAWLVVLLHRLFVEQRSRRKTEERFKSYVSPQVVDILVNNPELTTMKPQERELTVVFTDIVGFTTLAERLGSEGTADLLAQYLGTMTEIIQGEKATLDKYIGDAIVAFWGAPVEDKEHAANACRAVLKMMRRLDAMNAERAFGEGVTLGMRIGLATGELMVGDFGNPPRNSSYTVIGDTVNLGARLESANKFFGTRALASARVRELAGGDFSWRYIGNIRFKGKTKGVAVHELLLGDVKGARTQEWIDLTAAMVADYQAERFDAAIAKALRLSEEFGDRDLAGAYGHAVTQWQAGTVEGAFDGCVILAEK